MIFLIIFTIPAFLLMAWWTATLFCRIIELRSSLKSANENLQILRRWMVQRNHDFNFLTKLLAETNGGNIDRYNEIVKKFGGFKSDWGPTVESFGIWRKS